MKRFLVFYFLLFSSNLLGRMSSREIASGAALVKKHLASYELGEDVFLDESPLPASEDFSKKESRHYLYYYRGLGFFFEALSYKKKGKERKEKESLELARQDFEKALFSPYAASLENVRVWKENTTLALIDLAHRSGDYEEMTRLVYESLDRGSPYLKVDLLALLKKASAKSPYEGELFLQEEAESKSSRVLSRGKALREAAHILNKEIQFLYKGERSSDFKHLVSWYPKVKIQKKRTKEEKSFLQDMEAHFHLFSPEDFEKTVNFLWRKDQYSFALFVLRNALKIYKRDPIFPSLLFTQAKIYQEMKSYKKSEDSLKELIQVASGTKEHEKALYELAYSLKFFRKKKAQEAFENYLKAYPDGSYTTVSLYHSLRYELKPSGKNSEKTLGKLRAFFKRSPISYYSFLLGRDYPDIYNPLLKEFLANEQNFLKEAENSVGLPVSLRGYGQCFLELKEFGLYEEAEAILLKIRSRRSSYESDLFLLNSFREIKKLNQLVIQAMMVFARYPKSQNAFVLKETFPLFSESFLDSLLEKQKSQNLSSYLVMALMRQESAFDEEAVSPAGAIGLMQLMPSTAKEVARDLGKEQYSLQEKEDNLLLGTTYLKSLLERFEGNEVYALGAYNAGPYAMARWLKWGKKLDLEEFVERIPYKETSLYVKLIMRNFIAYQLLYGEPRIEKAQFFF